MSPNLDIEQSIFSLIPIRIFSVNALNSYFTSSGSSEIKSSKPLGPPKLNASLKSDFLADTCVRLIPFVLDDVYFETYFFSSYF